jgi:beta-galactosidase
MPSVRTNDVVKNIQPIEQLILTHDKSDYCWYSSTFSVVSDSPQKLNITYGGDFFYIYIDGKPITQSQPPLMENRGTTMPDDPVHPPIYANMLEELKLQGFKHGFILNGISPGTHRIDILAVALGLIDGDGQISGSMNTERKGIWQDVLMNGTAITNWEMRPYLMGEKLNVSTQPGSVTWSDTAKIQPCSWYMTSFPITKDILKSDADFRIDAAGLGKGMLYLNGHMLGRYWLIKGNGYGPDDTWHSISLDGLSLEQKGQPTQRYYNVPRAWLKENNQIIIFEEQAHSPEKLNLQIRIVK